MTLKKSNFVSIIVVLSMVALLVFGGGKALAADGSAVITVESKSEVRAGETVSLSVTVPENLGAAAMEFWLHYDSEKLVLTEVREGSALNGIDGGQAAVFTPLDEAEPEPEGQICFQWDSTRSAISAAGSVLELDFSVKEKASGDALVSLKDVYLYDSDMNEMSVTCVDGGVSISSGVEITVRNSTGSASPATIQIPAGGWTEGENSFSVSCEDACVALISNDGGASYTRLKATKNGDAYDFTATDVTENTILRVVRKGDIGCDGSISLREISQIRLAQAKLVSLDSLKTAIADLNGDGSISLREISQIRLAFAGLQKIAW